MTFSSCIGFGLLLLSVSVASSILLSGTVFITRTRLRALGPWVERRAAMLALLLPPLLGIGITVILGVHSILALTAGSDHCMDHPHHLHLCWVHGTLWAASPLAIGTIAFLLTFALLRATAIVTMHIRVKYMVCDLLRFGKPVAGMSGVVLIPDPERFAFTAGVLRPHILVSTAAWERLDTLEKRALIAHERTHIVHGDIWKRTVLAVFGAFGAPVLARQMMWLFEGASERLCDSSAAQLVGKPSTVAGAILALASPRTRQPMAAAAAHAAACEVTDRILCLFKNSPNGLPAAVRLGWFAIVACGLAIAIGALLAESVHHLLETILG